MSETVSIYTDGGCSGNPGPGGWGFVLLSEKGEFPISGGEKETTNNRMEMTAVIRAFEHLEANYPADTAVTVYIDSQYVKDGITKWIINWKKNGWKTASKQPVKNQDLWIALDELVSRYSVEWIWVKGHAGNKYNEIADELTQVEIAKFR